jgi:hypothetical protein
MAGVGTNIFASTGASVNASTDSSAALATATYGPPAGGNGGGPFSPTHGHGLGFWLAVGGVVVLVFIRQSLPR